MKNTTQNKIKSWADVRSWAKSLRQAKKRLVFTNGCFDLLHEGHVSYLEEARGLGDALVVAMDTDEAVRAMKGNERPLNPLSARMRVLAGLGCVDAVVSFDGGNPVPTIEAIRPDILVKGGDWKVSQILGAKEVQSWGGEVYSLPFVEGRSTTRIVEKMKALGRSAEKSCESAGLSSSSFPGVGALSLPRATLQREIDQLVDKVLTGDQRALSRCVSAIESGSTAVRSIMDRMYPRTGGARVLGITGPPGAGKSTVTDRLVALLRAQGQRVAVVAVDPSSPFSGGAILGDRIRMQNHVLDDGVFIRSLGTRGQHGGLSQSAKDVVMLLDGAGYDWVLVETAGVGQTELDIMKLAQAVCVVLVPESGDGIQMMKAGLMEIADLFVVNKCDRPEADRIVREITNVVQLGQELHKRPWQPPVLQTQANENRGVDFLLKEIDRFFVYAEASGEKERRRRQFLAEEVSDLLVEDLRGRLKRFWLTPSGSQILDGLSQKSVSPHTVVDQVGPLLLEMS